VQRLPRRGSPRGQAGETNLGRERLQGKLKRTTFQLRLFAEVLRDGPFLQATMDHAEPDWPMGARTDLRRMLRPIGPVAVHAASNFPFAFSVAGGDTASRPWPRAARCC
jgi:NADP-dependent aldehyde dehydrogenase